MLSATSAEPSIYRTEMILLIFSRSNAQQAPPQPAAAMTLPAAVERR